VTAKNSAIIAAFRDLPGDMSPNLIDAFDFSRSNNLYQGVFLVKDLSRLAEECFDHSGSLAWTLSGGDHPSGHPQLKLQIKGEVQLVCQRCLKPFSFLIDSISLLVLARDEEQADEIESSLEDDTLDVIVGTKTMSVLDLIEDDALLAIPQAPKHGECHRRIVLSEFETLDPIEMDSSPFAVLQKLKH
jgi:uncharacterized protein